MFLLCQEGKFVVIAYKTATRLDSPINLPPIPAAVEVAAYVIIVEVCNWSKSMFSLQMILPCFGVGCALSSRHPAVFILDDMQWADADTRELIRYLASRWTESKTPILLLLAVRQESFAADPLLREWLAQLGRHVPLTRLLFCGEATHPVR
jgi:hypothetical protein